MPPKPDELTPQLVEYACKLGIRGSREFGPLRDQLYETEEGLELLLLLEANIGSDEAELVPTYIERLADPESNEHKSFVKAFQSKRRPQQLEEALDEPSFRTNVGLLYMRRAALYAWCQTLQNENGLPEINFKNKSFVENDFGPLDTTGTVYEVSRDVQRAFNTVKDAVEAMPILRTTAADHAVSR